VMLASLKDANPIAHLILRTFLVKEETPNLLQFALNNRHRLLNQPHKQELLFLALSMQLLLLVLSFPLVQDCLC